jgi:hypothetical protein
LSDSEISGVVITIEDVLFNGSVEEEWLLLDESDLLPEALEVVLSDVSSVNLDAATTDLVEPQE